MNNLLNEIQKRLPGLSKGQQRIANFITSSYEQAAFMTAAKRGRNSAAAALSVKFKDNAVASFSGLIFLLFLPALGNYYQTQALHRGGELPWSYVVWSFAAALPFVVAFLLMGVFLMRSKDVG